MGTRRGRKVHTWTAAAPVSRVSFIKDSASPEVLLVTGTDVIVVDWRAVMLMYFAKGQLNSECNVSSPAVFLLLIYFAIEAWGKSSRSCTSPSNTCVHQVADDAQELQG